MRKRNVALLFSTIFLMGAANDDRPELWGDLRAGMTPEEVIAVLMAKPGVKKVTLRKPSKNGNSGMDVSTKRGAIQVAEQITDVVPVFANGRLEMVRLVLYPSMGTYCVGHATQVYSTLKSLLSLKYPSPDPTGTGFTDGRVTVIPAMTVKPSSGDYDIMAKVCQGNGEGASTASIDLRYMDKRAADSAAAAKGSADADRIKRALDGI